MRTRNYLKMHKNLHVKKIPLPLLSNPDHCSCEYNGIGYLGYLIIISSKTKYER